MAYLANLLFAHISYSHFNQGFQNKQTLNNDLWFTENKAVGMMKPGHCFTIEPMINEGGWRDEQWPDHWTAVTADGSRSAQVSKLEFWKEFVK